eukprot:3914578-Alexandrium_andersonii.AAC.1
MVLPRGAWADLMNAQIGAQANPEAPAEPAKACRPDWDDCLPGVEAREAARAGAGQREQASDAGPPPPCLP